MYHYRITQLNATSQKYGDCEVCEKYVSDVYHQMEMRDFDGVNGKSLTYAHCTPSRFGHEKCLLSIRKTEGRLN